MGAPFVRDRQCGRSGGVAVAAEHPAHDVDRNALRGAVHTAGAPDSARFQQQSLHQGGVVALQVRDIECEGPSCPPAPEVASSGDSVHRGDVKRFAGIRVRSDASRVPAVDRIPQAGVEHGRQEDLAHAPPREVDGEVPSDGTGSTAPAVARVRGRSEAA